MKYNIDVLMRVDPKDKCCDPYFTHLKFIDAEFKLTDDCFHIKEKDVVYSFRNNPRFVTYTLEPVGDCRITEIKNGRR